MRLRNQNVDNRMRFYRLQPHGQPASNDQYNNVGRLRDAGRYARVAVGTMLFPALGESIFSNWLREQEGSDWLGTHLNGHYG